jgi:hypothetical protein
MKKIARYLINLTGLSGNRFGFYEVGFHGDEYLVKLVDLIIQNCTSFIETGTNVGTTLAHIARSYPHVQCFSCEPNRRAFKRAIKNVKRFPNVAVYNETSQVFVKRLKCERTDLFDEECMFWLDAHGYGFEWPLKEELCFITTEFRAGYILIDDFKVPGLDHFVYHRYQGQVCSYDYVKDAIQEDVEHALYYPNYAEKTSRHHPLIGWGLIDFGHDSKLEFSESFQDTIQPAF